MWPVFISARALCGPPQLVCEPCPHVTPPPARPLASLPGLGRARTQQGPSQSLFYILCASLPSAQASGPVPVQARHSRRRRRPGHPASILPVLTPPKQSSPSLSAQLTPGVTSPFPLISTGGLFTPCIGCILEINHLSSNYALVQL